MDAAEFLKEKKRMCTRICGGKDGCVVCELSSCKNGKKCTCKDFIDDFPEEAVAIVEKWSKEHPQAQACGCDTCDKRLRLVCTEQYSQECKNNGYLHYVPDPRIANAEEVNGKHKPKPEYFIRITITEDAKKYMGVDNNVYTFSRGKFAAKTCNWLGKNFVQIFNRSTNSPVLMVDVLAILAIDYYYVPCGAKECGDRNG